MDFARVLVTGGAGLIGNRLVRRLSDNKVKTAIIDNLYVKMPMPEVSEYVVPYIADIRDKAAVERIFSEFRPQAIVHLAAIHHIPTCEREPYLAMDVNVMGTELMLEMAARHEAKAFVLASSAAVYDWVDQALVEDETPLRATDVYSTAKLANEYQLKCWSGRTGIKSVIARIFNVIGHDDPNGHLIPDILAQIGLEDGRVAKPWVSLGNTHTLRDYTHANDTASGLFAILDRWQVGDTIEAYNISRGSEHSVAEIVQLIGQYFGCEIEIRRDPARVRRVDRQHLLGDTEKTTQKLEWKAQYGIAEALKDILGKLVKRD